MTQKTKTPIVPLLKERERQLNQQLSDARVAVEDIDHREGQYQKACTQWGEQQVAEMLEKGPPGDRRVGHRYDWRVGSRPQPEDRARAEEVLAGVEKDLAAVRQAIAEAGPFDPVENARRNGHPYYTTEFVRFGERMYVPGESVSAEAVADLDRRKLKALTRWVLREV
jgi:hypothetical protein